MKYNLCRVNKLLIIVMKALVTVPQVEFKWNRFLSPVKKLDEMSQIALVNYYIPTFHGQAVWNYLYFTSLLLSVSDKILSSF